MCIFKDRREIAVYEKVKKREPIVAYKAVATHFRETAGAYGWVSEPIFVSPYQNTSWDGKYLRIDKEREVIAGANFVPMRYNGSTGGTNGFTYKREVPGIHAMRNPRTAQNYGEVVCRVHLWGKVYEYGRKSANYMTHPSGPGYLAENCMIDAIVWVYHGLDSWDHDKLRRLLKKFPSIRDESELDLRVA